MTRSSPFGRFARPGTCLLAGLALAVLTVWVTTGRAKPAGNDVLHIGTSGTLSSLKGSQEESALEMLRDFIKTETGLENEILRQKGWRELADKMSKGELQVGVFQGYEFAWAKKNHSGLRPVAVAVNVYHYPTVHVVARHDSPARDFAGLKGQALLEVSGTAGSVHLFVDHLCHEQGQPAKSFFSRVTTTDNAEDALDDLVDGKVQAVVADRASLEAFKRRKPARFKQLKEVAHSQPFPPSVVAYQEGQLDETTLEHFRDGLLKASRNDRGQTLLTMFKLTSFEVPPKDLGQVLARMRQTYPPPGQGEKSAGKGK